MRRQFLLTATALLAPLALLGGATTSAARLAPVATAEAVDAVEVADSADDVDWSTMPTTNVTLDDGGLAITTAGTYVLTGSSAGQVTVDADGAVRIVLSDATITSATGPAIAVDSSTTTVLELAAGTVNALSDGGIDAAGDLLITGAGSLDVASELDDGISADGELTIESGTITLAVGDDAISSERRIRIAGGTIDIAESVEGVEAPVIVIDGGDITLNASDDGINASASDLITSGLSITINDGSLTIVMADGDTDAIDSNGDLTITGGTLDITARSPFDFDDTGVMTGGAVTVNGEPVTELTNQMMGGPGSQPGGTPGR